MKRIVLFVLTNVAVLVVLSVVLKLLGLDRAMYSQTGLDYGSLLVFSAVVGFTGSIISLLMSKQIAKWSTGAHVIEQPQGEAEAWLVETVRKLFDLTRKEAELAMCLTNGRSLREAAVDLGITLNTARAHLRSIFAKTGIDRQARLVRAILRSVAALG